MKLNVLIFLAVLSSAYSQIQTWPPNGIEPSKVFSDFKLPASRIIPSSSRYNLIWADQIVPQWITPGKLEFAAKNYIGTQKIFADQAILFREFNPNFLIVMYHLAVGLNPEKNNDCPNPKSNTGDGFIGVVTPKGYVSEYKDYFMPWLTEKGITIGSSRFESMFQHYDSQDLSHRVWHQDPYWLMNIENPDWTEYITDICKNWMEGNNNEGCFFDVSVETNCSLYNPKTGNPTPGNFDWWNAPHYPYGYKDQVTDRNKFSTWMNNQYRSYYQKIYKKFHNSDIDYLVLPNIDQMVTTIYDPIWTDDVGTEKTIDGAMIEGFGNYTGQDMYLTLERSFRHLTQPGKIMIAQFGASTPEERLRRTGMYMLIKNTNSYINIINTGNVEWYPEYEIDLGEQVELPKSFVEMKVSGNSWQALWQRNYQNGIVLCNTSNSTINYDLNSLGWKSIVTSGGGEVSSDGKIAKQSIEFTKLGRSISIKPSDCVILMKPDSVIHVDEQEKETNDVVVYSNSEQRKISVNFQLKNKANVKISLVDLNGQIVSEFINSAEEAGEKSYDLHSSSIASGIYFVIVKFHNQRIARQIILE